MSTLADTDTSHWFSDAFLHVSLFNFFAINRISIDLANFIIYKFFVRGDLVFYWFKLSRNKTTRSCWFWMRICVGYFFQFHSLSAEPLLVISNDLPYLKLKREKKRKFMSSNLRKIAPDGIRPEDIQEFVVKSGWFLKWFYNNGRFQSLFQKIFKS